MVHPVDEVVDRVAVDDKDDQPQVQVNITIVTIVIIDNIIVWHQCWNVNNTFRSFSPVPFFCFFFTINFTANKPAIKTKEELDKELDQYMVNTKSNEIDIFMG